MNTDNFSSGNKSLSDEVQRKIGRNLLLFQQIEGLLKLLVANHSISGTTDDLLSRHEKFSEAVQKQTLGTLAGQYTGEILAKNGVKATDTTEEIQMGLSCSFQISGNVDFYENQRADMQMMVSERNDLVHHFLPRWQPDSLEHMTKAATYLEQQREKVLPMLEHLKTVAKSMQEARLALIRQIDSGIVELVFLQQSPLISLLKKVAKEKSRADGWTLLSHAGQIVRAFESDAALHMKERYGHKTLKSFLVASELFHVEEESLPDGKTRTVYREIPIPIH
jgi:hypothetical protein